MYLEFEHKYVWMNVYMYMYVYVCMYVCLFERIHFKQAIYFNRTPSRFALITEDDIQIPFNIDFEKLVTSLIVPFIRCVIVSAHTCSIHSCISAPPTWLRC